MIATSTSVCRHMVGQICTSREISRGRSNWVSDLSSKHHGILRNRSKSCKRGSANRTSQSSLIIAGPRQNFNVQARVQGASPSFLQSLQQSFHDFLGPQTSFTTGFVSTYLRCNSILVCPVKHHATQEAPSRCWRCYVQRKASEESQHWGNVSHG